MLGAATAVYLEVLRHERRAVTEGRAASGLEDRVRDGPRGGYKPYGNMLPGRRR